MRFKDLTGQRFTRLLVIKESGRQPKTNRVTWECKCDCGNTFITTGISLTKSKNKTKSCGCLQKEMVQSLHKSHGMSETRIYNIWSIMKGRCTNPKNPKYKDYGARGIKLCDEWLKFENFYNDMKDGYKDTLTIDRINNELGYCKENCRWANDITQHNNTRANHFETIDGVTDTILNHCRRYGIKSSTFHQRIKYGWSVEEAFKTKVRNKINKK